MTYYDELGVRRVVNAAATLTKLGGSRMPPPVMAAMAEGAGSFIDLHELQHRVGQRIAELTRNEACYVSSGAAAGIVLAVAACIAGTDPERIGDFPYLDRGPRDVLVYQSQRNGYDYAARQTGARLVELGPEEDELRAACSERTACILWFAGAHYSTGALALERVVAVARERGIPVIVDAAAQVPPVSSLWHFTRELGADLVIISGGKGLRGPQSSGLVLGRADLIEGCRANGNPNHAIGRPLKVGKEELLGILAAVEWTLDTDEAGLLDRYEATVQGWLSGLADLPGIEVERSYPSEAGQPHSRALLHIGAESMLARDALVAALWDQDSRIAVSAVGADSIALNPQTIDPGEEQYVLTSLRNLLQPKNEPAAGGNAER